MFEVIFLNIILDELTAEEYLYMHKLVGFYLYPLEDIVSALGKDIVNVKVFFDNQLIGIGRVVGDGRIVFFLKDIIVQQIDWILSNKVFTTIVPTPLFLYLG